MKTILRFVTAAGLVLGGLGYLLHAQGPASERDKGSVLLLKTGHAMEGDIEKIGAQFCVRRGKSETWLAVDKAVRLCADWDDAYAYARTLIRKGEAEDHLKLARWCHVHRMTEQALEQARAALTLQPMNAEAKQMATQLERLLKEPARKAAPIPVTIPTPSTEPAPQVDVSFETFVAFTTRVQPILMNTCVTCHAAGHGGKFQLERVYSNSKKLATQRNLAAVLSQVDLDHPAVSPLLLRALTAHGGAPLPPIKDRGAKPLQSMQLWVLQTVAKNPHLKDYRPTKAPVKMEGETNFAVPPGQTPKTPTPRPTVVSRGVAPQETPMPRTPVDDWDAEHFNRYFHPRR